MKRLDVIVVPPLPKEVARVQFRQWCDRHVELLARLSAGNVEVTNIRGEDSRGIVVEKWSYRISIPEDEADLLSSPDGHVIEIFITEVLPESEAVVELDRWLARRERLRDSSLRESIVASVQGKGMVRYRLRLKETEAHLLVPGENAGDAGTGSRS
jgi:hypothetical protein